MLTRHRRRRDLPLRNKTNLQEQQLLICRSPDTNSSSKPHRLLHSATQPDKYRDFLLKDSSDEEISSGEEEAQADDQLQKPPACRFIDSSKTMPSDDDDDDGDQEASDERIFACPERAFASTAPFPQSKKRVRFDSQEEDLESECESPSTSKTNSPTREDGYNSEFMVDFSINLKCTNSIKRAYPKLLQPPWSYRTSLDKLTEFVNMTHPEKWAARAAFQKMPSAKKQSVFLEIPGRSCTCCQQLQRKDKGMKRGPNKASRRRSKRVAGEMPPTTNEVCEYVSLAHSDARRSRHTKKQKVKIWKHRRIKNLDHARNTQDQGSELSLAEVYNAVRATIRAATFSSQPPRLNTKGQSVYEQRKEIPRLRIGLFVVNEVQETPEYGGQLPADRLRRPKTQIHYVSSCPEDLQAILETITLAAGDNENYEKTKFFGTGEEAMSNLDDFISKRKRKRARNISSKSLQDTQAGISMNDAPAI